MLTDSSIKKGGGGGSKRMKTSSDIKCVYQLKYVDNVQWTVAMALIARPHTYYPEGKDLEHEYNSAWLAQTASCRIGLLRIRLGTPCV